MWRDKEEEREREKNLNKERKWERKKTIIRRNTVMLSSIICTDDKPWKI